MIRCCWRKNKPILTYCAGASHHFIEADAPANPAPEPPVPTKAMNHTPRDTTIRTSCLTPRLVGAAFVAASAAGFGALAIFVKIAFADGASTAAMLFLRFSIAGVLMTALMAVCRFRWPR